MNALLSSERLLYSKFIADDLPYYLSWCTDDAVMEFITGKGLSVEDGKKRFEKGMALSEAHEEVGLYLVRARTDQQVIGVAKLVYMNATQAEVGYGLLPPYWGQGYASEILRSLIDYSQTIPRIHELIGIVDPRHKASIKVLTKQGFEFDGNKPYETKIAAYYLLGLQRIPPG